MDLLTSIFAAAILLATVLIGVVAWAPRRPPVELAFPLVLGLLVPLLTFIMMGLSGDGLG